MVLYDRFARATDCQGCKLKCCSSGMSEEGFLGGDWIFFLNFRLTQ